MSVKNVPTCICELICPSFIIGSSVSIPFVLWTYETSLYWIRSWANEDMDWYSVISKAGGVAYQSAENVLGPQDFRDLTWNLLYAKYVLYHGLCNQCVKCEPFQTDFVCCHHQQVGIGCFQALLSYSPAIWFLSVFPPFSVWFYWDLVKSIWEWMYPNSSTAACKRQGALFGGWQIH